jgi:hypothetical protein
MSAKRSAILMNERFQRHIPFVSTCTLAVEELPDDIRLTFTS